MTDAPENLPPDPATTYTFRATAEDGTVTETEMTAGQVLDLGAGKPVSYFVRDERLAVEEDGTIVQGDSAVPPDHDSGAAA